MTTAGSPWTQALRFGVVGIASNLLLYLLYLAATGVGLGHKTAMTLLFALGVLQTFVANRRWTFGHGGRVGPAFRRYAALYAFAYGINLGAMLLLVDGFGWPHQAVQAAMILLIALLLFVVQRSWVFAGRHR